VFIFEFGGLFIIIELLFELLEVLLKDLFGFNLFVVFIFVVITPLLLKLFIIKVFENDSLLLLILL
jgi:hypothetical protein